MATFGSILSNSGAPSFDNLGLGQAANTYKLSLTPSTSATGGIDFGGDISLSRLAANVLALSGRLDITSPTNSTALFGIGPMRGDEETLARTKIMAYPSSFTGTWSNGARGDQLYNDATNGPVFTNAAIYFTNEVTFPKPGTLVGVMADLTAGEVESTKVIASVGGSGNAFTSNAHGYAVGDVVTISGATTGTWTDINGTWRISAVTTNTFTCSSCTNTDTGTPSGSPVVLRHIYHDIDGIKSSITADAPGGNVVNEWGVLVNAGKWAKGIGLELLIRDQNTYASWAASNNETFQPTSNWRQTGLIGLAVLATPTSPQGQVGTGIYISNYGGAPHFRRPFVVASGYADNTAATDLFVVDLNGRLAVASATTVNQTTNSNGFGSLACLILPGGGSVPNTVAGNGIVWGTDANQVSLYRSANDTLKTNDHFQTDQTISATGAIFAGSVLSLTSTTAGYIAMPQLTGANPTGAIAQDNGRIYIKGDKLVIAYDADGTDRYLTCDLTSAQTAVATWAFSTTAP